MLTKPLAKEHIKDRLLGHWGTCPGINLVYSHCNRLIKQNNLSMLLVTGPGHGAPANIANLYLEGKILFNFNYIVFIILSLILFVNNLTKNYKN